MSSSMAAPSSFICGNSCYLRHFVARVQISSHPAKIAVRRCASSAFCSGSSGGKLPRDLFLLSFAGSIISSSRRGVIFGKSPLASLSSLFAVPSGQGGGGDGLGIGSGGGDGDSGPNGGGSETSSVGESEEPTSLGSDVIILDVGGMSCGGCAASVKRILENLPQVSSANVNLSTETAVIWATPEAKSTRDWQQDLGHKLASHLTTCGFKSNLRDSSRKDLSKIFDKKMNEKLVRLKESGRELVISWTLCAVCLLGHVSHFFHANSPAWLHALHSTNFHWSLSFFTLIGPGRQLILDGIRSLLKGSPNMNTLVGLGALSSFTVSSVAALVPKLGWKVFFEEPIMLIAFVLLGKNLEQRAKLKATSDMTGLLSILPSTARLLIRSDAEELTSTVEVPCSSLSVGDRILVFPGDRVPADGTVKAGRSTVDESSFTGEPLPATKLPGSEVTAGSINLNGTLTIEVQRPGGETVMGDIVRMVEEAQSREAPVQRLADEISGRFTYGVMALSAATFIFWSLVGPRLIPAALQQRSSISLALQLSCSVLVIACPCALGLATPTAVMVGTSLGATKGLLIRGGNILEKFAGVDAIVFDKTGTLTEGKPIVTRVLTFETSGTNSSKLSETEILRLAAGVESNTVHPVGKAIVEAAKSIGCHNAKVDEGTFHEEPGSGVTGFVDKKQVVVGTLEWLRRHGVNQNALQDAEENENQSTVYVGVDGELSGMLYVEDKIRDDAKHVIKSLSNEGINIYMLSGDRQRTANHVASKVGIDKDKVFSSVKPNEKKKFVTELERNHKMVAMVGDGINDAAALASVGVGIAMGGGVGAASDVSSIVLMGNKLSQLIEALELSKSTMKTVRQNLLWAFGYNIVGIPVAAGVLLPLTGTVLTPSIAGALMGLSSVGVMANSLLLRIRMGSRRNPDRQDVPEVPRWKST